MYLKNRMKHKLFFYCVIRTKCIWLLVLQLADIDFLKIDKGKFTYEKFVGCMVLL